MCKLGGEERRQFSTYFTTWAAIKYIWTLYKFGKIPQIITWALGTLPSVFHFNLCLGEQFLTQGVEIYTPNHVPGTLVLIISSSNLTHILRSFFQQVHKNIPNISVSSEYFISKGDKTYSTSTGSCHTYWAYFLGVWSKTSSLFPSIISNSDFAADVAIATSFIPLFPWSETCQILYYSLR